MNFFDAQDKARRSTRWLVIVYIIATLLIVAGITAVVGGAVMMMGQDSGTYVPPSALFGVAVIALVLILGATLYKTARLSSGGGRVAKDLGGTLVAPDVRDPLRRRLRNVVEEMAIASGVPVPEIYVLEEENGINAFAAGYSPGDAAVAVTRGCLDMLDRDELQGVIAHEFSHILNGDMRLNIRMMGVLFGIMVVGMIGRMIVRSSYRGRFWSRSRDKNAAFIIVIGIGLAILGWIGIFTARLIKAAVSRQREFLADASAVQFTRQTDGIANALKKIGGYSGKSYITSADPEEVSHMLFAGGVKRLTSKFATHPPLTDRIQALDPQFRPEDYPSVQALDRKIPSESDQVAGFNGAESAVLRDSESRSVDDAIADSVGKPQAHHILFAKKLRSTIPAELYEAAHTPDNALLLAIALSWSADGKHAERQLRITMDRMGKERTQVVESYYKAILKAGTAYRLALLEIAFPMLKNRPVPQIEFLLELVKSLIEVDGKVDLGEYCFYRILSSHLMQSVDPRAAAARNRVSKKAAQRAAVNLVRLVADEGHDNDEDRQLAYEAGVAVFGGWSGNIEAVDAATGSVEQLDGALDVLKKINSAGRQSLLRAVSETVTRDGKMTLREAELLRAICATLDCPLPPILGELPG